MTFSLVARCSVTGMFGMVISSSSPAVAARCVHLRAGVGAVASQNITDPALGAMVLDALATGMSAPQALFAITTGRPHIDHRQVLVIDKAGQTACHSGGLILGIGGQAMARDCLAAGNLLANAAVPLAMTTAFCAAKGAFGDRLMAALHAGLAAGGEAGPVHSAGMKIVDKLSWPLVDLRSDWSDTPISDLETAWQVYKPQIAAYVQRAIDPSVAPSYGVPGDA